MKHAIMVVTGAVAVEFLIGWASGPAAQMSGGGQGGQGMMGGMHHEGMMQQMSQSMEQMHRWMNEMHGMQEGFRRMKEAAGADTTASDVMAMASEMSEIMPHWDAMLEHMNGLMNRAGNGGSAETVEDMQRLMEHMGAMIGAGSATMSSLHQMSGDRALSASQSE